MRRRKVDLEYTRSDLRSAFWQQGLSVAAVNELQAADSDPGAQELLAHLRGAWWSDEVAVNERRDELIGDTTSSEVHQADECGPTEIKPDRRNRGRLPVQEDSVAGFVVEIVAAAWVSVRHHQPIDASDLCDRVLDLIREIIRHQRANQIEALMVVRDELRCRHIRKRAARDRYAKQCGEIPPESDPSFWRDRANTLFTGYHEELMSLRRIAGTHDVRDANTVRGEELQRPLFIREPSVCALDLHDDSLLPDLPEPGFVLRPATG